MEQISQNQTIETEGDKPPEALEAKTDADPAVAAYSSQAENNPLSQAFTERYGVEYSDPQALAEDPDKPSPEISIVIPVHNEGEGIIGLLESLSSQASDKSAEIVLVINNDTVGTRDIIDKAIAEGKIDGSRLRLVDCSYEAKEDGDVKVGGVGLARKIGMDYAVCSGSETIVSLDADWKVEDGFIDQIEQTMSADVDGFTFQTEGIANDDSSREYLKVMGQVQRYREALDISAINKEVDSESPLDKSTGAVHVVRASGYAKAGGMVPVVTGEDGRFGTRVSEGGARLKKSEITVGVEIRESDTPGGQGESLKKFNEGIVTNPDKPGEYITIEQAQEMMENNKEFQAAQERKRKIDEISEELIQELANFYNKNKGRLETIEFEDIDLIKEEAKSSPLISKYLLTPENDFSRLIGILEDSATSEQFISTLKDKLGDAVRERIEESEIEDISSKKRIEIEKTEKATEGARKVMAAGETSKSDEQELAEKVVSSLEPAIREILEAHRLSIENGDYSLIVSDEVSGRMPAKIIYESIRGIYQKKGFEPPGITFLSPGDARIYGVKKEHKEAMAQHLLDYGYAPNKGARDGALIVTQHVASGKSMRLLAESLRKVGYKPEGVTISKGESGLINDLLLRYRSGVKLTVPQNNYYYPYDLYLDHELEGVVKSDDANKPVPIRKSDINQPLVNAVRKEIHKLSEKIAEDFLDS